MMAYYIKSPYVVLRDGGINLDRSAAVAGKIKNTVDELRILIDSLAHLTTTNTHAQEVRAKELLTLLIAAKHVYTSMETKRLVDETYGT